MTKLNLWTISIMLLGGSVLQSCGGIPAEPMDATSGPVVLAQFGTSISNLPKSNSVPSLPIGGVTTSSVELKSVSSCETVTPSPTVDADGDSIAAYKKYAYDCTDTLDSGYIYTRKGSVEIRDMDETKAGMIGGIRVDFDVPTFKSTEVATGNPYEYTYGGYWSYKNEGGTLVSLSEFSGSTKYKSNTFENDYKHTSTWSYKLTPTSQGTPWDAGTIEMEGVFQLAGKFVYEDGSGNHGQREGGWMISYKSKNLTYQSTCTKFYKSGSFVMEDSANKIEIVYSCTTAKLYVNGTESTWWTP